MREIKCTINVTCLNHLETIPRSLVHGKLSSTKLMPKRLGTAALDNACIQLQGVVRGIGQEPEKRHQGDRRETQRGMSVMEPARGWSFEEEVVRV